MRVLVVGGAGYIGSHTCKRLAQVGHEPVVLDNLARGHEWAVKWGPLIRGDVRDASTVRMALRNHKVEAVVHFAAYSSVGESMTEPRAYFDNNVLGTLNLLGCMLDEGVKHIVFSSTAAVYGIPAHTPLVEEDPQVPVNPYGESKLAIERMLHWYSSAYGLRYVALRYFNAAGADPACEIGEWHDPESHLIPLAINAALGKRGPITLFGLDYPTHDGTAIRDYIHVTDLASAHVSALEYLAGAGESTSLNLGSGNGFSVNEILTSIERVSGKRVPFVHGPRRPGDPPVLVACPSKAKRVLGWMPERSSIDDIISTAWRWHSEGSEHLT